MSGADGSTVGYIFCAEAERLPAALPRDARILGVVYWRRYLPEWIYERELAPVAAAVEVSPAVAIPAPIPERGRDRRRRIPRGNKRRRRDGRLRKQRDLRLARTMVTRTIFSITRA